MARPSSREIEAAAADWAARMDRAPLSGDEERAFEAWLASDVRCQGAFARVRGVALYTERASALGKDFDPESFIASSRHSPGRRPAHRRHWWTGGAAMAASVVAAVLLVHLMWPGPAETFETRKGEMRVVSLADGSVMTLNTRSQAIVSYTPGRRNIRLVYGEGLFEVAGDPERPFEVDAGDTRVRAVGTSFSVRRDAGLPVEVLVREGEVEVDSPGASDAPVLVKANMRLVAAAQASPVSLEPSELYRELAWREGRIAFEGETLGHAAAQFARYSDTRIVFADPSLADERITGLFHANDPVGFARAVASSLELQVELGPEEVRLYR